MDNSNTQILRTLAICYQFIEIKVKDNLGVHIGNQTGGIQNKERVQALIEESIVNAKLLSDADNYSELWDSLSHIVKHSPCCLDEARLLLRNSNDVIRDTDLIVKMKNAGLGEKQVLLFIKSINC